MKRVKEIVHARRVYQEQITGKEIRIAVLDTGAALHPELADRIIYFRDFVKNQRGCYDDNGHGTHIAGILCANGRMKNELCTGGMAPEAELLIFKVLDRKGNGKTADFLAALQWILDHHRSYNIRLLNFSVGFVPYAGYHEQKELLQLIDQLWEEGVTVIAAAGNNGPSHFTVTVPGISRKVITVGACDDDSADKEFRRGYSGKGPTNCCIVKPEILAPGTKIYSLCHANDGFVYKSGTSMAAPVVCGACALAFEKNPSLTPAEIKLLLYESVNRKYSDTAAKSWGILDVDKLIEMIT